MPIYLFWFFATLMLLGGAAVIAFRNPVSSALSVIICFLGLSGLFIGLSAFFVGLIQILVYTGAVMVLFLFIIMLLDLNDEAEKEKMFKLSPVYWISSAVIIIAFVFQLIAVLGNMKNDPAMPKLDKPELQQASVHFPSTSKIHQKLKEGSLPDVHLIGNQLFTQYNYPLQILGVLLLVSTVGVVVLSKRQSD